MPAFPRALLRIADLNLKQVEFLLAKAKEIKNQQTRSRGSQYSPESRRRIVALVFLEPSTRTRVSFEIACHRLGLLPVVFSADGSSSMAKGETPSETLETILAMRPDAIVLRHGGDNKIEKMLVSNSDTIFINAGDGISEHPTQALLDAMTIEERRGKIKNEKIVFVGDVEHSRVARSGRSLFEMLGAEVAVCGPTEFEPKTSDWSKNKRFSNMREAMSWCSVCVGLRIQSERHSTQEKLNAKNYIQNFRLDAKNIEGLAPDGLIMHPGPFVPEVDLSEDILSDRRCVIRDQVENGVYMRMAVLGSHLGLWGGEL